MAASYGNGEGDELIGGVNITPLVDVCLTLLIVFIVTASFVVNRTVDMQVPGAATGEVAAPPLLTIAITRAGEVWLNGAPASLDEIPRAVAEARARAASPEVKIAGFVSADVAAPYGRFAEAVDRLRLAGVTEIALDTQPPSATP
jgi:biopolymer transport protein ExbD